MTDFAKKSLYYVNAKAPVRFIDTTTDAHDGCIYHLVVVGENGAISNTAISSIDDYDFGNGVKVDLNGILKDTLSARNTAKHGIPIVLRYDCAAKTVTGAKALVQDSTVTAQDHTGTVDSMVFNPSGSIGAENIPRNNGRIAIQGDKILVSVLLDLEQIYLVNSEGKIIIDGVEHLVSDRTTKTSPHGVTVMFQLNRSNFKVQRIIEPGNLADSRRTVDNTTVAAASRNTDCIFDMIVDNGFVYYLGMVGMESTTTGIKFRSGSDHITFTNLTNTDTNGRRSTFLLKLNRKLEVIKAIHVGHLVTDSNSGIKEFRGDAFRRFTFGLDASKLYIAGQTSSNGTELSLGDTTLENLNKNRPILLALTKQLEYSHHKFFDTDHLDRFTDIKINGSAIFVSGLHRLNDTKTGGLPSSYYTNDNVGTLTPAVFKLSHNRSFDVLGHYYVESNSDRSSTVSGKDLFKTDGSEATECAPTLELTASGVFLSVPRLVNTGSNAGDNETGAFYVPQEQSADGRPILLEAQKIRTDASADNNASTALFHLNMDLLVKKIDFNENALNVSDGYQANVSHTFKIVHSGNSLFASCTFGGNSELHELLVRDAQFASKSFRYPWDKMYDVNQILTAGNNLDDVVSGVFEYGLTVR